jgi:hypothetical protein
MKDIVTTLLNLKIDDLIRDLAISRSISVTKKSHQILSERETVVIGIIFKNFPQRSNRIVYFN